MISDLDDERARENARLVRVCQRLERARKEIEDAEKSLRSVIEDARRTKALTWEQIGDELGLGRHIVARRYGPAPRAGSQPCVRVDTGSANSAGVGKIRERLKAAVKQWRNAQLERGRAVLRTRGPEMRHLLTLQQVADLVGISRSAVKYMAGHSDKYPERGLS